MQPPNDQEKKSKTEADSYWAFALDAYARDGVSEALIDLQDKHNLNVNLMLWACWTAGRFAAPDDADITAAIALTRPWSQSVTEPLRAARRAAKPLQGNYGKPAEELRQRIKDLELRSEKLEIDSLDAFSKNMLTRTLTHDPVTDRKQARVTLNRCCELQDKSLNDHDLEPLFEKIIGGIFNIADDRPASGQE